MEDGRRNICKMFNSGFVKAHRSLKDWEWIDDFPTLMVFIFLMLAVNHQDKRWQGIEIKRGELVSSYRKIAEETGLTKAQVETVFRHFKKSGEVIAAAEKGQYTKFILPKYGYYQDWRTTADGDTGGYVKLFRTFWPWVRSRPERDVRVFLRLLLTVSFKSDGEVKRGEREVSYRDLADETGLTKAAVEEAVKSLVENGEIQVEVQPGRTTKFIVCNFEKFQGEEPEFTGEQDTLRTVQTAQKPHSKAKNQGWGSANSDTFKTPSRHCRDTVETRSCITEECKEWEEGKERRELPPGSSSTPSFKEGVSVSGAAAHFRTQGETADKADGGNPWDGKSLDEVNRWLWSLPEDEYQAAWKALPVELRRSLAADQ